MRRAALLACLVAACGGAGSPSGTGLAGGPVPPPRSRTTGLAAGAVIGPEGGTVTLDDIANGNGALTMTVPPGAVAAPVSFTLDQIAVDPASVLGAVGPGYRIGPAGTTLGAAVMLSFLPPAGQMPDALTIAHQGSLGYWMRLFTVTRDAATVSAKVAEVGDYALVTTATQRDLTGSFTLTSTQAIPFTASGTAVLEWLAGSGTTGSYLPIGTITLSVPVTRPDGVACTTGTPAYAMHASIADLTAGALQWGLNAEWHPPCDDGASAFVSTNFDSFGIANRGCARSFSGTSPLSGTYFIDC